jgi:HEAT repeat protein
MAVDITKVCDPERYGLTEAIQLAKDSARASPGFEIEIVRFLQVQCGANLVPMPTVFRGLEVLGGMLGGETTDQSRLITLLRPFLRSKDRRIASKCVLVLGRMSSSMVWLRGVMAETDERIRASLIESLWKREEPEVELVLRDALNDKHPRVAANAVYGLYLLGVDAWEKGLERLLNRDDAGFRISGIWVLKSTAVPNAPARLKLLIRATDAEVRRAAFDALIHLRNQSSRKSSGLEPAA